MRISQHDLDNLNKDDIAKLKLIQDGLNNVYDDDSSCDDDSSYDEDDDSSYDDDYAHDNDNNDDDDDAYAYDYAYDYDNDDAPGEYVNYTKKSQRACGIVYSDKDDNDEEHEISLKEEEFCDCAYTFYLDIEGKISELDWLLRYAECCEELLSGVYENYKMKPDFYRRLGAEFGTEKVTNPEDYTDETLLEELREMMFENYTWLFGDEE